MISNVLKRLNNRLITYLYGQSENPFKIQSLINSSMKSNNKPNQQINFQSSLQLMIKLSESNNSFRIYHSVLLEELDMVSKNSGRE